MEDLKKVHCSMGSTALVIENMKYYVLDGKGEWREIG
jgi:hypothetical protein